MEDAYAQAGAKPAKRAVVCTMGPSYVKNGEQNQLERSRSRGTKSSPHPSVSVLSGSVTSQPTVAYPSVRLTDACFLAGMCFVTI